MLEVPMYRESGTRVQLVNLLAKMPGNDWTWSIIEFDGVGRMPSNVSVLEFQKRVREQPQGFIMTWSEMSKFAEAVEYTIDCLIVAVSHIKRLDVKKLLADDFHECEIALRAIDSTEWILFASDRTLMKVLEGAARD
jgi:hypothetical protein